MPRPCSIGSAMGRHRRRRIDVGIAQRGIVVGRIAAVSTRALARAAGFLFADRLAAQVEIVWNFSAKSLSGGRLRVDCSAMGEMNAPHRRKTSIFLQRIRNNAPRPSVAPTQQPRLAIKQPLSLSALSVKEEREMPAELLRFNIRNNPRQLVFLLMRIRGLDA